ncbi:MAG TPA: VWA domain-containing protein [Bryobacteraceae bacterium]|nr:VWA domain-containing protein [Bryobacteraceae bacterium]
MSRPWTRRSFLGALALAAHAAERPQDPTFSSDVKVVNVLASVRTKDGTIVSDLTQDDFILAEDNRLQKIRYFSRETNLPLILGLLVDTSGSQINVLDEEVTASYHFLDRVLREGTDRTFLAHFDFDTELLQDLTTSKAALNRALDNMQPSRGGWRQRGGGTTLYDAVYLAGDEVLKKQQGRKAVVILTDGVDHGSKVTLNDAIEHAERADIIIYSIMFEGDEPGGNGGGMLGPFGPLPVSGYKILQKMARETGGGFFEVSRKRSIDEIYRRIEEELRSQYSIGYTPDPPAADPRYRTIELKTHRKGLVVQARKGYYPQMT